MAETRGVVMALDSLATVAAQAIPSSADGDIGITALCLVVAGATSPFLAAIVWQARRIVVLEDRLQANIERQAASGFATADALNRLTSVIEGANPRERHS